MKKTTFLVFALLPFLTIGQKAIEKIIPSASFNKEMKELKNQNKKTGLEVIPGSINPSTRAYSEDVIGTTVYDLQTNSSPQRRIINHGDGTLSATFTYGDQSGNGYLDRGAGYNYYNGTTWGANPTSRVETTRNGWPALAKSGTHEIIVSHSGTGGLTINKRPTKGSGTWTESIIPTNTGQDILWPRIAIGGDNDSTIHVVGVVISDDTTYRFKGLLAPMLYYRSQDLGATWDVVDSLIPAFDSTNFLAHGGDNYSIDARKNVVSIAIFPFATDLIMVKSTDNGDTWTSSIVNDFPVNKYQPDQGFDLDSNNINDSLVVFTTDGSGSVIIDNNDQVHVFFGGDYLLDDNLTDGGYQHLPLTGILAYWNESLGQDNVIQIAGYLDYNNDDTVYTSDFLNGGSVSALPDYGVVGLSMPSTGINANNDLFVTYAAYAELHSDGSVNRRHIYIIKSTDGGLSWTTPADFTPDFNYDLTENVFPSMAKLVDDNVHVVYQRDYTAGSYVLEETGSASINDIVYLKVDTSLQQPLASIEENTVLNTIQVFPNPANESINIAIANNTFVGKIEVKILDVTGRVVYSFNKQIANEKEILNTNISSLKNGLYTLSVVADKSITTKTFIKQ